MKDTTKEKKYRNFSLTQHLKEDMERSELLDNAACRYVAYALEHCPTTGKPHFQAFICFHNATTKKSVIKMLPGCHVESMNGSLRQNEVYCSKEGELIERGDKPFSNDDKGRANQLRWQRARELAKSGLVDDIDADIYIQYYNTLKKITKDHMGKPEPLTGTCGLWIYGKSGTGKSHSVITQHPNRYIKPLNKWWDGYQGEDVVHMDEICPEHVKWLTPYLKKWADKWPFDAEVKGGAMQLRPKLLVVTSNYSIEEMCFTSQDADAIKRRFREVEKTRDQNIIVS